MPRSVLRGYSAALFLFLRRKAQQALPSITGKQVGEVELIRQRQPVLVHQEPEVIVRGVADYDELIETYEELAA